MTDSGDRHYSLTLTPRQRRLAGRLEGFGDIVFGFAVSQCALQLTTVNGHVDIAHPLGLLLYFGTFALLASLWMTYHKMLSGTFRPAGIDLVLAFSFLALVSLLPFSMYAVTHEASTVASARNAVAEYACLFAITMLLACVVVVRNLKRGWEFMDEDERVSSWADLCMRAALVLLNGAVLIADLAIGPYATIPVTLVMFPTLRLIRNRSTKHVRPALLGIKVGA